MVSPSLEEFLLQAPSIPPRNRTQQFIKDRGQKQRYFSLVGWAVAVGVFLLLSAIVGYGVYVATKNTVLSAAIAIAGGSTLIFILTTALLRRCNYSLPCFLLGVPAARHIQPIQQMKEQPVLDLTKNTPAVPTNSTPP